jgi:hypothetical protein
MHWKNCNADNNDRQHAAYVFHNWELGSRIGKLKSTLLPELKMEKNGGLNTINEIPGLT